MEIGNFLQAQTGIKWEIKTTRTQYVNSIANIKNQEKQAQIEDIKKDPLVRAILAEFAGASIETITRKIIEEQKSSILETEFDDIFFE